MNKKLNGLSLMSSVLLFTGIYAITISCSSDSPEAPQSVVEEKEEPEEAPSSSCSTGKLFIEKNGIVRVDIENPSKTSNGWSTVKSLAGFEGSDYLIWTGADNFNAPGQGLIKFSIKITNAGTYQFIWSSRIGAGTSKSEHNDSWLRIKGDDFFGEKSSTGHRVYPKGSGKTPNPEGSSKDGWLKVYMNRLGEWFWKSNTNDKDAYDVFVTFDKAGEYDVEISGRSNSHAIDQFVLFQADKTLSQAQNAALSEITCK